MKRSGFALWAIFLCLSGTLRADDPVALGPDTFKKEQDAGVKAIGQFDPAKIRLYLYSLNPDRQQASTAEPVFHGFPILGQTEIMAVPDKRALLQALAKGVNESDGMEADCFEPRHGLRVVRGDQVVDFVICYTCLSIDVYGLGSIHELLTGGLPMTLFNHYLDLNHLKKAAARP